MLDEHRKFWTLIANHGALDYFDDLRRTWMTTAEKAVESDVHSAIRAVNARRFSPSHAAGVDLIAGVLQLPAGEIFLSLRIYHHVKAKRHGHPEESGVSLCYSTCSNLRISNNILSMYNTDSP
jgi:hypothetical protein